MAEVLISVCCRDSELCTRWGCLGRRHCNVGEQRPFRPYH